MNRYQGDTNSVARWIRQEHIGEALNLWHLTRTALSGKPCGRWERLQLAAKWFAEKHGYLGVTAAYKDIDALTTR